MSKRGEKGKRPRENVWVCGLFTLPIVDEFESFNNQLATVLETNIFGIYHVRKFKKEKKNGDSSF